jgi:hypothetical protein
MIVETHSVSKDSWVATAACQLITRDIRSYAGVHTIGCQSSKKSRCLVSNRLVTMKQSLNHVRNKSGQLYSHISWLEYAQESETGAILRQLTAL